MIWRLAEKAIRDWQARRLARSARRVMPDIFARRQKIAAAQANHKPTKPLVVEQVREMTAILRRGAR